MNKKRPGKLVKCSDGRIGRTYNDEPAVKGKIRVHLFSRETAAVIFAKTQEQAQQPTNPAGDNEDKRLCDPTTLTVLGFAD
jgi:hypothetical protein